MENNVVKTVEQPNTMFRRKRFTGMVGIGIGIGIGLTTLIAPSRCAHFASLGGRDHHSVWATMVMVPSLIFLCGKFAKRMGHKKIQLVSIKTLESTSGFFAGLSIAAIISVCVLHNQVLFRPICIPFNATLAIQGFCLNHFLNYKS